MKLLKKALLLAVLAATAASPALARKITDDMGRSVNVPDKVSRVVVANIFPYASVATVYLGGADKIVGIHPVSMSAAKGGLLSEIYPDILKADTSFMKGASLSIERLMALKPDVVFVNAGDVNNIKAIENAGMNAVAISASKWNYDVLKTYEHWLGTLQSIFPERKTADKADAISKKTLKLVQGRVSGLKEKDRKRVLFLFQYGDKRIVTSGRHFFGQYWCDAIGAKNVAEGIKADNANAIISMEQIYAWNPDIVFVTNFTPALPSDLYSSKIHDWSHVKAVKEKHVYKLPLGIYRSYTPSADTPMTLLWMAKTVYPELFKDISLKASVKSYYKDLYGIKLSDAQVASIYEPRANRADGFGSGRSGK